MSNSNSIWLSFGQKEYYLTFCCYLFHLFSIGQRLRAEGILFPNLHKALFAGSSFAVTATNAVSNATITSNQWLVNGVVQSNSTSTLTPNLAAGTYTVQYLSQTNQGCSSDTANRVITVHSIPTVNFSSSNGCVGTAITLTNASTNSVGNPLSYSWLVNGITVASSTNFTQSYTTAGNYAVLLIATTTNGCTDSAAGTVSIHTQPTANFTYDSACLGKPVTFTSSSTNATGVISTYNWVLGNGQVATTPTAITTYTTANTYTVSLQVGTANGCSGSTAKVVPITAVQLSVTTDTVVAANQPLQLQAAGAATYIWSPSFGLNNASIPNPIATLQQGQLYSIRGVTASGCVGTASVRVVVYNNKGLYIPTIFTPNGDGVNDVWKILCSGVQQLTYLRVYNRWGQLVYKQNNCNQVWDGTWQARPLQVGTYVYTYEVVDYTGTKLTGKGTVIIAR